MCHPYARRPTKVSVLTLGEGKKFYHVTQRGKTVYAIRHKSHSLHIFDDDGSPQQRSVLRLKDLRATSLAASDTGSVYLTARSDNWIWRIVSTSPSASLPERWITTKRTPNTNYPLSLSLYAGRLLVTKRDELIVFDLNGTRRHSVVVQGRIHMRHAVETPIGSFVACAAEHRGSGGGRFFGLVAEIDGTGKVLRSFNIGGRQSPLHLDVDSDGNCFVIDSSGCTVIQLSAALDVERLVLKCNGSERGTMARLCCVAKAGQLLVATKGGHLYRYRVRHQNVT
jgi:hypothetical protein